MKLAGNDEHFDKCVNSVHVFENSDLSYSFVHGKLIKTTTNTCEELERPWQSQT